MTVISDSDLDEGVPELLSSWLTTVADAGARAIVILGPSVKDAEGKREVLVCQPVVPLDTLHLAVAELASSDDFAQWPLVSWQNFTPRGDETLDGRRGWREMMMGDGIHSYVRVALELPGNKAFEIFTLCNRSIQSRADAGVIAWAAMGAWPAVRKALAKKRLKLSTKEQECLQYVCAGLSARSIAERMGTMERNAVYFVNKLTEKFDTKGRLSLPTKAAWLGLLD